MLLLHATLYLDPNIDPVVPHTAKMTKEVKKKASLKYYQRYFFPLATM
jgi:hypothetical protein